MQMFRVLREVYVKPGELITLEMVNPRVRYALIERGIVEPVEDDEPAEERAQSEEVNDDGD